MMSNTESADSASRCPTCGCVGPNPGYEPMNENEILAEMSTLRTTWQLAADQKSISRQFVCRNWQAAMNALQAIGQCAERADIQHHPDLHLTNYREVEVRISTHACGGLTKYDFLLARAIDNGVVIDYSPKWLNQHPEAVV